MICNPCPGFETVMLAARKEDTPEVRRAQEAIPALAGNFQIPEGMRIETRTVPVDDRGTLREMKIYVPENAGPCPPIVMDLHGGGWRSGNPEGDTWRCIEMACKIPAIVASFDYRLADGKEVAFPTPLMDCIAAFRWLHGHGEELGGDPGRMGVIGHSAGANLAEGMSLYARDHKGLRPAMTALVCPPLSIDFTQTVAYHQWYDYKLGLPVPQLIAEPLYLGGYNGQAPSYYAFPLNCQDLAGLEPHMVVAAEYDTLRDDALRYADRLLKHGVQCELYCAARVGHCYNRFPHPYSRLLHDVIAAAFQREFRMAPYSEV
ncbi:MAG: alpha/beta hydrolase [Lawsonibacter sp.]|nr:alpha/beta hydrolase [Lawsonibacter sp.]